jgi:predicted membrane channel-forming protein YqfA (hemolysin III family)
MAGAGCPASPVPYGRGVDETWIGSYGWVTLALVNAGLAEQKGRSRWTWFLVSLILGPVATLFIVTWARVPARAEAPPREEGPTRGLLAVGLGLLALSVIPAAFAVPSGDVGLWLLAAGGAAVGVVALVLHVLAHRRWDARAEAPGAPSPTTPAAVAPDDRA